MKGFKNVLKNVLNANSCVDQSNIHELNFSKGLKKIISNANSCVDQSKCFNIDHKNYFVLIQINLTY